jgi:nitrate reductase NapE component
LRWLLKITYLFPILVVSFVGDNIFMIWYNINN